MPSISKNQIIWDYTDWLAGLNEQYSTDVTYVPIPLAGNGLSSSLRMNPFRNYGYITPGFSPTDITNVSVVANVLLNSCLSAESGTSYAYLIEQGSKLHRMDISTKTLTNAGSWPHTITGAGTITGSDVIAYTANVGGTATPCVFYSWNDSSGAWNIGRFRTDTGAFDDDFMSTVPASALTPAGNNKPHAMWIGANDIMYIWDGNVVQAYDGATGADGTCSTAVLTVPQGYIGTAFAPYDGGSPYLACFAYYAPTGNSVSLNVTSSTQATCFLYDYLSLDPVRVIPINDRSVSSAFSWKGTIGCFCQGNNLVNDGANRNSRLKVFNGVEFETVVTYIGNAPTWGGVDIVGDAIQWTADGKLYSYGAPFENIPATFNCIGGGLGTSNGVVRTIGGTTGFQMLSTGATTLGGLQYMKVGTFDGNAAWTTQPALPVFSWGMRGQVEHIRVEFAKTTSGGHGINLYMVYDNSDSTQILSNVTAITSSNQVLDYDFSNSGGSLPQFTEMRINGSYTAGLLDTACPVIKRVVVTFSEVGIVGT